MTNPAALFRSLCVRCRDWTLPTPRLGGLLRDRPETRCRTVAVRGRWQPAAELAAMRCRNQHRVDHGNGSGTGQSWMSWAGHGVFWKRLVRHAARPAARVIPSTFGLRNSASRLAL